MVDRDTNILLSVTNQTELKEHLMNLNILVLAKPKTEECVFLSCAPNLPNKIQERFTRYRKDL